ncbi:nucleotidyltransferase family protein [Polaromonas sp.]|uniref:nucleotidyltransferase family protein n=1 Tax=Polaromonas sp. TaxID=1869339 RepID=UPI002FC7D072
MPSLPVVIVLAAGHGERFAASGGTVHKLEALLAGKPVLDHVLDAVRASGLPLHVVRPDALGPDAVNTGMGDSIAAGVRATADASGWLILPADLPLIRSETLRAIALAPPSAVTVPLYQGRRGHPVRFAAACGPELLRLKGNQGAAQVVRAQEAINSVAFVDIDDPGTVTDIDTLEDLRRAEVLLRQR